MGDCAQGAIKDSASCCRQAFCIGGVSIEIEDPRCDHPADSASLEAFRIIPQNPDIAIRVEWIPALAINRARRLFDSGCTWELYEERSGFCFDFFVPSCGREPYKRLMVDPHFRKAKLQMSERARNRATGQLSPLTYPLDELLVMHRLTQEAAIELHGCGIVRRDGTANLFVGHSGSGKSTMTRLWAMREEVEILSDDRIIVRKHETPQAAEMRMYGTPWHGEAAYASPASAALTRILILEHGRGNVLTQLSSSQAVAELFARSFVPFHRHEYVDTALTFLQGLAGAVPVYRYAFEPDQRAVDAILNLDQFAQFDLHGELGS